ncbi:alpha-(1-_3)-fucosyltransferase [Desmophyllum pertusum]|uniref:Alpha-(1->3)-fucosyltransferase n=1 Tax=Desmophyllum pertusum TaxID=174260 RepID=A0A9W9ZQV8_9CNID|nr:alpha-(1->3)-fucosyltransferase [Desmophyllum pertusum]
MADNSDDSNSRPTKRQLSTQSLLGERGVAPAGLRMEALKRKLTSICYILDLTRRQRRKLWFCFCTALMALTFLRMFYYIQDNQVRGIDVSSPEAFPLNPTKLILVYTPYPFEPWGPKNAKEAKSYKFTDWDGTPCEETRCQITFDKTLRNVSDAVLVHYQGSFNPSFNIEEIKRLNRPYTQRWVLYTKECPGVGPIGSKADGAYNWTATYRRDSDFFVPYGSYAPLEIQNGVDTTEYEATSHQKTEPAAAVQPDNTLNYARGKTRW